MEESFNLKESQYFVLPQIMHAKFHQWITKIQTIQSKEHLSLTFCFFAGCCEDAMHIMSADQSVRNGQARLLLQLCVLVPSCVLEDQLGRHKCCKVESEGTFKEAPPSYLLILQVQVFWCSSVLGELARHEHVTSADFRKDDYSWAF